MRKYSQILFVALLVLVLTLSHPISSYAKQEPPNTTITVTVNNLGCSTSVGTNAFAATAFTFGASNSGTTSTGGGAGAGKANISDLNVSKAFNECSPAIFGAVVTGKHFPSVKLVHADANGNPVLTIELQEVLVSSYQIGGSAGPDVPIENVSFNFAKVCITDSATNTKLCYDAAAAKTFGKESK
jgi:type VI protein secretion system component Hcp